MDPFARHAQGLAAVQTRLGNACPTFTWNGAEWDILPGGASLREKLLAGGFALDADLSLTCLVGQFGNFTAEQLRNKMLETIVTYLGHTYKISRVIIAAGGQQLRLMCNDWSQVG